jgi:hypothetical protein
LSSLLLMNFLDVARSLGSEPLGATPDSVATFIRREFKRSGGSFNYNSSIISLPSLYNGDLSVEAAVEFCLSSGSPVGRAANAEAVQLAGSYATEHKSNCYRIPFTAVPVGRLSGGRTAFMAIKAPLVRVKRPEIYVVVPGFRLGHRPQGAEIDVAASLALANFARDDFSEADFEYLDCSRGLSGERELRVYHGAGRHRYDLDTVDELLGVYVRGLQIAIDGGMPAREPNFRGYRIIDPDQPHMI